MKVIYAPTAYSRRSSSFLVFLAGSIEMGKAEPWQEKLLSSLLNLEKYVVSIRDITLLNPRRPDWDSSWTQDESDPKFNEQVNWELEGIIRADVVFFYFDPETKSPVSLLELGIVLGSKIRTIVVCPPGFWRKGNVDIACRRHNVKVFDSLDDGIREIVTLRNSESHYTE